MATGGGPSPNSVEDRRQSLTCSFCLDIFAQPKVLPCLHNVCLKCLEDLTSRQSSSTFPCPHCRSEVTVPAGGVSAFPTNFHIRVEDLDIARKGTHCLTHHKQVLDQFCTECQLPVCVKCVITKHRQHNTQNLSDAAAAARAQLKQDKDRLRKALSSPRMIQAVEAEQREQQILHEKAAAVKSTIPIKYATMVALAEKCRDELLASLDTVCAQIEDKEVNTTLSPSTDHLHVLSQLEQQLQQTLTTGTPDSLVTLAKEMREGKGSAQAVENMTSARGSTITHPVLNSLYTLDTLNENVEDFFRTVTIIKVMVEKKFMCKTEPDTEVLSLCPLKDGTVWVSYASCGLQNNALSELFQESGQRELTHNDASGKRSWKCNGNGQSLFSIQSDSQIITYSKHRGHYNHCITLWNRLNGQADILGVTVTPKDPFNPESHTEFTINVGSHKALDVDSSEQFFAVVEEPQAPDHQRKVKLYQRNQPDAIATYTPPSKPFNPADVCFFTLGGKEVLTIADEAGDSVHVVHVQAGGLTFMCQLAPGCPLLVKPTALNTDHRGRLWVACRGGTILTMTPISS